MSVSMNALGQQMTTDGRVQIRKAAKNYQAAVVQASASTVHFSAAKPNLESIKAEIERVQAEISSQMGRKVEFNINHDLGKVVVKIVDPATDKVIKEIPSEDIQKLQIRMGQLSAMIVDEMI